MTEVSTSRVERIFCEAIEIDSPKERVAYVSKACRGFGAAPSSYSAHLCSFVTIVVVVAGGQVPAILGQSPSLA